ncbi:MAG: transporter substrate-binding domain-containing protein [Clostridia bacterium]
MKKLLSLTLAALMAMTMLTGCSSEEEATGELAEVQAAGVMNIGYTVYEPMNYEDESGVLTGFDTEFAQAVCEKLGVEPNFIIINWDTKVVELDSKNIDAIWNGMTITDELQANISTSNPYVKNAQVVVINTANADKYTDTASLVDATIVAESGSAGELAIYDDADLSTAEYIPLAKQTDALLEVKSGAADAAVFDWTLAKSVIGEGTDFADLMMIEGVSLSEENYGIGFRKDSDLKDAIDEIMVELIEDGTLPALAEKYGLGLAE